jgi:hypothetical protein
MEENIFKFVEHFKTILNNGVFLNCFAGLLSFQMLVFVLLWALPRNSYKDVPSKENLAPKDVEFNAGIVFIIL